MQGNVALPALGIGARGQRLAELIRPHLHLRPALVGIYSGGAWVAARLKELVDFHNFMLVQYYGAEPVDYRGDVPARVREISPDGVDAVVTQNVDGLHAAAGSDPVVELHGALDRLEAFAARLDPATVIRHG